MMSMHDGILLVAIFLFVQCNTSFGTNQSWPQLAPQFTDLLIRNRHLIVLEPALLKDALIKMRQAENKTEKEVAQELAELHWRFDLRQIEREHSDISITVGVFADQWFFNLLIPGCFQRDSSYSDQVLGTGYIVPTHYFYHCSTNDKHDGFITVHIVILHRLKHYLWIGNTTRRNRNAHIQKFSQFNFFNEQIYDPFGISTVDGISFPDDIAHFLSQLETAQIVHCSKRFDPSLSARIVSTESKTSVAISNIKNLMRDMKMQIWLSSKSLLYWYQECDMIVDTKVTELNTWQKYAHLPGSNFSKVLRDKAPRFGLHVSARFGKQKLAFQLKSQNESTKMNLFFSKSLLPSRAKYRLCSVDYFGYKMLAPCDLEEYIMMILFSLNSG